MGHRASADARPARPPEPADRHPGADGRERGDRAARSQHGRDGGARRSRVHRIGGVLPLGLRLPAPSAAPHRRDRLRALGDRPRARAGARRHPGLLRGRPYRAEGRPDAGRRRGADDRDPRRTRRRHRDEPAGPHRPHERGAALQGLRGDLDDVPPPAGAAVGALVLLRGRLRPRARRGDQRRVVPVHHAPEVPHRRAGVEARRRHRRVHARRGAYRAADGSVRPRHQAAMAAPSCSGRRASARRDGPSRSTSCGP